MATAPETFPQLLLEHARARGARPAVREKTRGIWRTHTWSELAVEAERIAAALRARGVGRGAHVALVGDNRPRLQAAMCAIQWLGAIAVPLYQDASAGELAEPLLRAEVVAVFAEDQQQVDKLLDLLPRLPALGTIVFDNDRGMRHYAQPQLVGYDALLEQGQAQLASNGEALRAEAGKGRGDEAAFLFFTAGTSGPAKGVVVTHASLIDRARAAMHMERIDENDVTVAYLPPGWIGQNFFGYAIPLVSGACVGCPESSETMLSDTREIGPTIFLAPPRVLEALLAQIALRAEDAGRLNRWLYTKSMAHARRVGERILAGEPVGTFDRFKYALGDLLIYGPLRDALGMGRLRVAFSGGDAIHPGVLAYFRAIGVNLKQFYGTTETGFLVAMQRDGSIRHDHVGAATPGVEIRIGADGEILVRSAGLFREYHGNPQATAAARDAEGWFRTGDRGSLGEDGQLRISGGAARALEHRLKDLPWVREAVAFGVGGDGVDVLIDMDPVVVGRWAGKRDIAFTGHSDLASRDETYALVADAIAAVNAELASSPAHATSQVRRFAILHKELDADDGVLTRTGKLRRAAIEERFGALVDAMKSGSASASVGALVGSEAVELKIREVRLAVAPSGRNA